MGAIVMGMRLLVSMVVVLLVSRVGLKVELEVRVVE